MGIVASEIGTKDIFEGKKKERILLFSQNAGIGKKRKLGGICQSAD